MVEPLSDAQMKEAKNLVVAKGAAEKARGHGGRPQRLPERVILPRLLSGQIDVEALPEPIPIELGQPHHSRENLSDEVLAMFDILLQFAADRSDSDRAKVKKSARELVERIKALLVLNWQQKCEAVFAHIEKAYPERDLSIYAGL